MPKRCKLPDTAAGFSLDGSQQGHKKLRRSLEVGARCYAEYSDGIWYWGEVANVSLRGGSQKFSVSELSALVFLTLLMLVLTHVSRTIRLCSVTDSGATGFQITML
jgi:hypothetical protein